MKSHYEVFTPSSPPGDSSLLVGREEKRQELLAYIKSPGTHPVVVGHRGVGKTSLVQSLNLKNFVLLEANTVPSFDRLARAIASELEIPTDVQEEVTEDSRNSTLGASALLTGQLGTTHKHNTKRLGLGGRALDSYDLRKLLERRSKGVTIALDELDGLEKGSDIRSGLATFFKSVSNRGNSFPHKFVLLGIGRDTQALLGEHSSAFRSLKEVYLPPLGVDDIYEFLVRAQSEIGVLIPDEIKRRIADESQGFPYYAHEVGFHSMEEYYRSGGQGALSYDHYLTGRNRAADAAFSHLLQRYKFTIYELSRLERSILQQILWSRHSSRNAIDRQVAALSLESRDLAAAWEALQKKGYVRIRQADARVTLQEPLAKPFLRIKIGKPVSEGQMKLFG